ncbi:MAG: UV-endonuclease UvdE [Solirubrobacterales bacterium]|nr:UV-endonuclease UvdE [Solirubrobacterales bacterium]
MGTDQKTSHRLGFAVSVLGEGGLPSHDTRRWQSGPHLRHSLDRLRRILEYLDRHDIRMYRMASALAPYASHPELTQFHGQVDECGLELAQLGELARERRIRLSLHPGQYTVLNSTNPAVVDAAIAELEVHAALLDAMALDPDAVVVLHVGGATGGKRAAADRFLAGYERLSPAARLRLVVENDDRSFGLADVIEIARRADLRVVWDALHHHCNDPERIGDAEALGLGLSTWPAGQTPKIHYSSPRLELRERRRRVGRRVERTPVLPPLRAHADMIDPIGFEHFMRAVARSDFDVMLEAKGKDLALLTLRAQLVARGWRAERGKVLIGPAEG